MKIWLTIGIISLFALSISSQNIGINEDGSIPESLLHIKDGSGSGGTPEANATLFIENSGDNIINIQAPSANSTTINFGDQTNSGLGGVKYYGSTHPTKANCIELITDGTVKLMINENGQVKMGDNISAIGSSSLLELESTTSGFVLPRMTQAQIDALTPQAGMLVYNTTTNCIYAYESSGQWGCIDNGRNLYGV
jgi:hypothetical protein